MLFRKKRTVQANELPPLVPRTIDPNKIGLSFEEFTRIDREEHPMVGLEHEDLEGYNEFDGKIQYLFETVEDMSTQQQAIRELWDLVLNRLLPEAEGIMDTYRTYMYQLMSITVEARLEKDEREKLMNRIEGAAWKKVRERFLKQEDTSRIIGDLNLWLHNELIFVAYLELGRTYSDMGNFKSLYQNYAGRFESLKTEAPATYVDFVTTVKQAYQAIQVDYQVKFFQFVEHLALQAVLVSRNAGFFDSYEKELKEYYTLKLKDKPLVNRAYDFFTGYGERPWRLVRLLLIFNLLFALIFSCSSMAFNGIEQTDNWGERLVKFFYFNNTSMLTIGYGDIYPKSVITRLIVVFIQLIGFSISSAAVALFLRRILRF